MGLSGGGNEGEREGNVSLSVMQTVLDVESGGGDDGGGVGEREFSRILVVMVVGGDKWEE